MTKEKSEKWRDRGEEREEESARDRKTQSIVEASEKCMYARVPCDVRARRTWQGPSALQQCASTSRFRRVHLHMLREPARSRARSQTTVHHIIISLNLCSLLAVTIIILNVAQPGGRFPLAQCYPHIVSRTPYFLPCLLCNSVVLIALSASHSSSFFFFLSWI